MESEETPKSSFSAGRRWGIFFSVIISIVTVCALVVMLNYLATLYYKRAVWSNQANYQLSPQTLALLKSITNQVKVIVYYDKNDDLYNDVTSLLDEYHLTNPKITVQKVDYLVEAPRAMQIKSEYNLGGGQVSNVVIFDCEGRHKVLQSSVLSDYAYKNKESTNGQMELERQLTAFEGEKWFSAYLLNVINPKRFKAYFLQGHGEPEPGAPSDSSYYQFAHILDENNIEPAALHLVGTNTIPADCNLLIVAGPRQLIPSDELEKIRQYLNQGGRMFALFDYHTRRLPTGLESVLADWNVDVGMNVIGDPPNKMANGALSIMYFNKDHPLVAPLLGYSLAMAHPRSVAIANQGKKGPEAPSVVEIAYTGPESVLEENPGVKLGGSVPVMVAVEKGGIKGVMQERGTTAILVAGDSEFLSDGLIEMSANRDFASLAVNWLLDQTQLLKGVGPHVIKEYKLDMTQAQIRRVQWIFLGAMPGSILAFGVLVWFRRRH